MQFGTVFKWILIRKLLIDFCVWVSVYVFVLYVEYAYVVSGKVYSFQFDVNGMANKK